MMKNLFLFALLFISFLVNAQGYGMRELSTETASHTSLPSYDTVAMYINPAMLSKNIHYYDGQRIFFLPSREHSRKYYSAMSAFYHNDSVSFPEFADTTWYKKRKSPRPQDFSVTIPKSNVYRAAYYNNAHILRFERTVSHYSGGLLNELSGFFTPRESIEGKQFAIDSVAASSDRYTFFLRDEYGASLFMHLNKHNSAYDFIPILMCASYDRYVELVGQSYVGRAVMSRYPVLQRISDQAYKQITGDITISAASLVPGNKSVYLSNLRESIYYYTPMLFFKDQCGDELMMPIDYQESPSQWSRSVDYEKVINAEDSRVRYFRAFLPELVPATEYYAEVERKRLEAEAEQLAREQMKQEREVRIRKQYSPAIADLILEGKVKLGMSKAMCREAWGEPTDINTTSGSWGVHEQWVYGMGSYLYFDNGILTSIQN